MIPKGLSFGVFALGLGLVVTFAALGAYLTASCALACPTNPQVCYQAIQECVAAEQQSDLEWMAFGVLVGALGIVLLVRTRLRLGHWTAHFPASDEDGPKRPLGNPGVPSRLRAREGRDRPLATSNDLSTMTAAGAGAAERTLPDSERPAP